MVSCEIITGRICTPLVGAYLPPSMLNHLIYIKDALCRFQVLDAIVLGDLSIDLDDVQSPQSQLMEDLLTKCLALLTWSGTFSSASSFGT